MGSIGLQGRYSDIVLFFACQGQSFIWEFILYALINPFMESGQNVK